MNHNHHLQIYVCNTSISAQKFDIFGILFSDEQKWKKKKLLSTEQQTGEFKKYMIQSISLPAVQERHQLRNELGPENSFTRHFFKSKFCIRVHKQDKPAVASFLCSSMGAEYFSYLLCYTPG